MEDHQDMNTQAAVSTKQTLNSGVNSSSPGEGQSKSRINQGLPRYDGIYVKGKISGVEVTICVDTGAVSTVISDKIYHQILDEIRPDLKPTVTYQTADGKPLKCLGYGEVTIQLGNAMVDRNVLVASITEDVLLGADFLQDEEDGPVDIFFSQGKMRWKGLELPFLPYNTPANTRKVHAADHYIVPAMSEMIMDVYVERTELNEAGDVLIEPHERTSELRSLVIANCIVNLADNATVKIRVMNPNIDEISIKQDTVLGLAHRSIKQVTPLFDSECAGEVNCDEMRSPPINSKTSTKLKRITKKNQKDYLRHLIILHSRTSGGLVWKYSQRERTAGMRRSHEITRWISGYIFQRKHRPRVNKPHRTCYRHQGSYPDKTTTKTYTKSFWRGRQSSSAKTARTGIHPTLHLPMGISNSTSEEEGWNRETMCRLQEAKCRH